MPRKSEVGLNERVEAVLSLLRREETAASLSRRLQVSEQTLYRWRDTFIEGGRSGMSGGEKKQDAASRRIEELEREAAKRAQVIGELALANGLLKKLQTYPS